MPILIVTAAKERIGVAKADSLLLRQAVASELSVAEWPIDEEHISLRFYQVEGDLIGDLELEMFAHHYPDRVERKDEVCTNLRFKFEARWKLNVRVWLHLVEMGYGMRR